MQSQPSGKSCNRYVYCYSVTASILQKTKLCPVFLYTAKLLCRVIQSKMTQAKLVNVNMALKNVLYTVLLGLVPTWCKSMFLNLLYVPWEYKQSKYNHIAKQTQLGKLESIKYLSSNDDIIGMTIEVDILLYIF